MNEMQTETMRSEFSAINGKVEVNCSTGSTVLRRDSKSSRPRLAVRVRERESEKGDPEKSGDRTGQ
jgi:hypothetical protein